eukprot:758184-Hanusia_phi.AAC.11
MAFHLPCLSFSSTTTNGSDLLKVSMFLKDLEDKTDACRRGAGMGGGQIDAAVVEVMVMVGGGRREMGRTSTTMQ